MITDAEVERIPGATVYGADGEKIGTAGAVYRDDQTGRPEWVTVQTGLFGTSESFVPLAEADLDGEDLRVPYDKATVKDAPRVDDEGHLDISEEDRLFEHYGVGGAGSAGSDVRDEQRDEHRDEQRDDVRDGYRTDARGEQRTGTDTTTARDDRFADGEDIGRRDDRSPSGLGSSPLAAGAATGATGGHAAGRSTSSPSSAAGAERRPRLSQWVLVKREDIIEVPAEEAERLAAQEDGGARR